MIIVEHSVVQPSCRKSLPRLTVGEDKLEEESDSSVFSGCDWQVFTWTKGSFWMRTVWESSLGDDIIAVLSNIMIPCRPWDGHTPRCYLFLRGYVSVGQPLQEVQINQPHISGPRKLRRQTVLCSILWCLSLYSARKQRETSSPT